MKLKFSLLFLSALFAFFAFSVQAQNTLEGFLYYHNNPSKPIPGSEITLTTPGGELIATATTNNLGKYTFTNIPDGTYELNASTTLSAGGVTLTDSYLLLLHLLGFYNLTPIQQLAADVTGNGQIGWDDYTTIVIGWFLNGYPFPVGDWAFTSATVTTGYKDNTNLGGTSAADLNGTYIPFLMVSQVPSVQLEDNLQNSSVQEICSKDGLLVTGFALYLDLQGNAEISHVESPLAGLQYTVVNSQLRITWMADDSRAVSLEQGSPIVTVSGENLNFVSGIESHFITTEGECIPNVQLFNKSATGTSEIAQTAHIFAANNHLKLEVVSPERQHATLRIFDMAGRCVEEFEVMLGSGINQQVFQFNNRQGNQLYTFSLNFETKPELNSTGKFFISR